MAAITPDRMSQEQKHEAPHGGNRRPQDAESAPATQSDSAAKPRGLNEVLFVATICCSQLLTQAGLAMSILPQSIIARSFHVDNPQSISWFTAGYSLTVGTFILVAGRLGDTFGHKRFFVGGFLWFGVWSALAGVATYGGPIFFAFCRAMQGIGPAFLLPNGIAMLTLSYEPGLRLNIILSLFGATAPSGFLLGAVFSSLLSELWWPWAFWVMCFTCLVLALLAVVVLPTLPSDQAPAWERVDILGSLTGVASLILFNFAWNQGPATNWQPYTYVALIIGVVVGVGFFFVEKKASYPLVPLHLLTTDAAFTLACIGAGWSSFGIFTFYSLSFLEIQRHQAPLLTSAQFSPIAISGLCAAVTTAFALSRLRASTVMLLALMAFLVGGTVLGTMPADQTYWAQTFVGTIVLPWGMDMSFPAATIILSRVMPREHQGLAASLVNTFVNYSISLGLGLAGTVQSQVADERAAFYMGMGLAGLGVVVALSFCIVERSRKVDVSNS